MIQFDELSSLITTLKSRAERLRDLRSPLYFENIEDQFFKASKNLRRIDRRLAEQLESAEQSALASL